MLLIELLLFYTEGQYQNRVGHKPTLFRWHKRGMGAKLSSIAQFTAQSDDVVIIDEHTIVR